MLKTILQETTSFTNPKQAAGHVAAQLIQDGMMVGLGTGSTADFFINSLILRCKEGLKITAISSSIRSMDAARKGGINVLEIEKLSTPIDITVDGADEIDVKKRMIKGGGGASVREKIIANSSREMIVVVDNKKLVSKLGAFPLPIEMLPFGCVLTIQHLNKLGYRGKLRYETDSSPYVTENGNFIFDIHFEELLENPEMHNTILKNVPGVLDTGFFFNMAGRVIVGFSDGHIEIRK